LGHSERGANADLPAAQNATCEQKVRNVGARDEHQRAHSRDQHQQRRSQIAFLPARQRRYHDGKVSVERSLIGIAFDDLPRDGDEPFASALNRRASLDPAD
jgi:hypothetical protein